MTSLTSSITTDVGFCDVVVVNDAAAPVGSRFNPLRLADRSSDGHRERVSICITCKSKFSISEDIFSLQFCGATLFRASVDSAHEL